MVTKKFFCKCLVLGMLMLSACGARDQQKSVNENSSNLESSSISNKISSDIESSETFSDDLLLKNEQISASDIVSEKEPTPLEEDTSILPNFNANSKYEQYIFELGWLKDSSGFNSVSNISPEQYVMWYATYQKNAHPEDEQYLSQYFSESEGRAVFPAEEYETTILKYFNTTTDHLRSDPNVYISNINKYGITGPVGELAESSVEITQAETEGNIIKLYFTLNFPEFSISSNRLLIIEKTDTAFQYISYAQI